LSKKKGTALVKKKGKKATDCGIQGEKERAVRCAKSGASRAREGERGRLQPEEEERIERASVTMAEEPGKY